MVKPGSTTVSQTRAMFAVRVHTTYCRGDRPSGRCRSKCQLRRPKRGFRVVAVAGTVALAVGSFLPENYSLPAHNPSTSSGPRTAEPTWSKLANLSALGKFHAPCSPEARLWERCLWDALESEGPTPTTPPPHPSPPAPLLRLPPQWEIQLARDKRRDLHLLDVRSQVWDWVDI